MPTITRAKPKKIRRGVPAASPTAVVHQPQPVFFDYQGRTRLVFGVNTVERAGELALELGSKRILLVTDPGIVAAGHADRVRRILAASGLTITLYENAREN